MITHYDGEPIEIPNKLPLLPVRDMVVFPYMIMPLFIGRDSSIKGIEAGFNRSSRLVLLASQKDMSEDHPSPEGIHSVGTVAMIMRTRALPDGRIKVLTQGICKALIKNYTQLEPFYEVEIEPQAEDIVIENSSETQALMRNLRENLEKAMNLGKVLTPDILMLLDDVHEPGRLADLVASNLGLKVSDSQMILEAINPIERLKKVHEILSQEIEVLSLQAKIRSQAKEEMAKSQKEYFLREQMRAIKTELGDNDAKNEEIRELREKILAIEMPRIIEQEALKQLARLERMHAESSEASILRTYLDWLIETPWNKRSQDHLDLSRAKKILDEEHFNLVKIKERILEYLAVRKLKEKIKGPLLCLSGPPGVGKTSLGRSIAKALGREFVRISLGGIKDEAEIRGHRRTYVGALPGRIIQALKQAGTCNPVVILDEIDKLGSDFRGDPSAALLEVLDPEQNHNFRDHYLNLPYDLSNVIFIATCNTLETIPSALKDRMEVLQLSSYSEEEKFMITKKYLISKQITEHGIEKSLIEFEDKAIETIVREYTRESGLRNLERHIASLCRKVARLIAEGKRDKTTITASSVYEFLGPPVYLKQDSQEQDEVGIATGLAWTAAGGEVLSVEAISMKGRGAITLTGQLGEVMKESGQTALGFIRSRASDLGISENVFATTDIHVHFPSGAIPKDGPSAGITMASAIVSRLTGMALRKDVAMTGEISLTGRVLPIGGLKEKSLAAMRHGITTIVFPEKNLKDLEEIPEEFRSRLTFVPVKTLDEVLAIVLVKKTKKKSFKKSKVRKFDKAA